MKLKFWCACCREKSEVEYTEFGKWPERNIFYAKAFCPFCGRKMSKILNRKESHDIVNEKV